MSYIKWDSVKECRGPSFRSDEAGSPAGFSCSPKEPGESILFTVHPNPTRTPIGAQMAARFAAEGRIKWTAKWCDKTWSGDSKIGSITIQRPKGCWEKRGTFSGTVYLPAPPKVEVVDVIVDVTVKNDTRNKAVVSTLGYIFDRTIGKYEKHPNLGSNFGVEAGATAKFKDTIHFAAIDLPASTNITVHINSPAVSGGGKSKEITLPLTVGKEITLKVVVPLSAPITSSYSITGTAEAAEAIVIEPIKLVTWSPVLESEFRSMFAGLTYEQAVVKLNDWRDKWISKHADWRGEIERTYSMAVELIPPRVAPSLSKLEAELKDRLEGRTRSEATGIGATWLLSKKTLFPAISDDLDALFERVFNELYPLVVPLATPKEASLLEQMFKGAGELFTPEQKSLADAILGFPLVAKWISDSLKDLGLAISPESERAISYSIGIGLFAVPLGAIASKLGIGAKLFRRGQTITAAGIKVLIESIIRNPDDAAKYFVKLRSADKLVLTEALKATPKGAQALTQLMAAARIIPIEAVPKIAALWPIAKGIVKALIGIFGILASAYTISFSTSWFAKEGLWEQIFFPFSDRLRDYRREPTPAKLEILQRDIKKLEQVKPLTQALIKSVAWLWPWTKESWLEYANNLDFELQAAKDEFAIITPVPPPIVPPVEEGDVAISTDPPDAKIYEYGAWTGETTPTVMRRKADTYSFTFKLAGYESRIESIEFLAAMSRIHPTITLEPVVAPPAPPPVVAPVIPIPPGVPVGYLMVETYPLCEVWSAGKMLGTSMQDPFTLPIGDYTIELRAKGFESRRHRAFIKENEYYYISAILEEIPIEVIPPPAPEVWDVTVTTTPVSGARIFIDGAMWTYPTPTKIPLLAGTYTLRSELAGYYPAEITLPIP